jgi:hypothetical protein
MKKFLLLFICVFMFSTPALAQQRELEMGQIATLLMAKRFGNEINEFGETWPRVCMSILYQESWANHTRYQTNGVVVGDKDSRGRAKSLGPMQVQRETARFVGSTKYPDIFWRQFGTLTPTDEELTIALLTDLEFNIEIGCNYFHYLLVRYNGNWRKAILAYNRGPGGVEDGRDPNNYLSRVLGWMDTIARDVQKQNYTIK